MDYKSCILVDRSLLKITNDDITSVTSCFQWHISCRCDSATGSHDQAQVCCFAVLEAKIEDVWIQVFAESNTCVCQITTTAWSVTLPASIMDSVLSGISHSVISHVLSAAVFTYFKIGVAMQFRQVRGVDAASTVHTVSVLTDDELEMTFINELNHAHVSLRW